MVGITPRRPLDTVSDDILPEWKILSFNNTLSSTIILLCNRCSPAHTTLHRIGHLFSHSLQRLYLLRNFVISIASMTKDLTETAPGAKIYLGSCFQLTLVHSDRGGMAVGTTVLMDKWAGWSHHGRPGNKVWQGWTEINVPLRACPQWPTSSHLLKPPKQCP